MSRKLRIALVLLLAVGFIGYRYWRDARPPEAGATATVAGKATPAPPRMLGKIAFKPCTLAPQLGAASVEAQCGSLPVPENPALPEGRKIALNIAWVPAKDGGEHAPDPVFMLAGGPGQAATETFPSVAPAFAEVRKRRDVILVDQRGTGGSHPLLCKSDDEGDDVIDDSPQAARIAAERCRDALAKDADLRFFTTTDAVRDLEAVRQAIGAEQINLIGISYGTRVAQQYARRHPAQTRTITLDSVAPNTIYLGNDFARNLETALDLQFKRCAQIPNCANALGDPRQQLNALMTRLKADPPQVTYRDARTHEQRQETLQPGHVAGLARMYAYAPIAASLLPLLINEASQGRYEGLMALSNLLSSGLADQMAHGMQLSVICSEDADGIRGDPSMASSLLGNVLVDTLLAQCAVWPKGERPADFHQPLKTSVPALLISGELDPVTPPSYAEQVLQTLPKGRSLVLRGQGHNVIGAGCMPKLFAQFVDGADAKALDASCLDKLAYTPPFTSFSGWEP
ncbi:pimeloyl-ACP methyl ester carboxylesterase [Luteimonas cucumeris]|uniref:Pimeloyl-ACP methyl ester carboxylesterase n=1 Tax=Luteimonas cucumeris TaxID=985012 RepID=A0A562KV21_9GAMM|nr:alpha/beta fold hydrolase [Luteimonas cucumeris]TWH99197.1 pimeloyl-ACP methyl ester carboxylesterase [Luteimonas cucumeris]